MSGLVWAASAGVAVALHLVLVQQGLAGLEARAPRPPATVPQVEILAPALRVAAAQVRLDAAPVAVAVQTPPVAPAAVPLTARSPAARVAPVAAPGATVPAAPMAATPAATVPGAAGETPVRPPDPTAPVAPGGMAPVAAAPAALRPALPEPAVPPVAALAERAPEVAPVVVAAAAPSATAASRPGAPAAVPPRVAGLRPVAPVAAGPPTVAHAAPRAVGPVAPAPSRPVAAGAGAALRPAAAGAEGLRPVAEVAAVPAVVASLPPQEGAARAGIAAPVATAEADSDTYEAVLAATATYPAGPCFAALPGLSDKGVFQFETFALSETDLAAFRQSIEAETGRLPNSHMKPVSPAQCRALAFLTESAAYPAFQLVFDLPERSIASGSVLTGRLVNTSGGFISLLLIDDEGLVQDLGGFLRFTPGAAIFSIPMTLRGAPVETQQLLMALSTPASLATVREGSGTAANTFFAALTAELQARGVTEDIALIAFSVR
jgi:hypothetical protein